MSKTHPVREIGFFWPSCGLCIWTPRSTRIYIADANLFVSGIAQYHVLLELQEGRSCQAELKILYRAHISLQPNRSGRLSRGSSRSIISPQQGRSGRLSRSITSLQQGRSGRLGRRASRSITSLQQGCSGRLSRRSSRSITSLQQGRSGRLSRRACLLYTSPSPRDYAASRMPSSA